MFPRHLELAIKLARANPNAKWKLAAISTGGGRILGVGLNTFKQNVTPPGTIHYSDLGIHAEHNCLKQFAHPKQMYVARISKSGQISLARPCDTCYSRLVKAGVKRITYTIDNENFGEERIR